MENDMDEALKLLQKIIDYNEGKGKYNFSNLSDYDRANAADDAWQDLRDEIKVFLKENKSA